MDEHLLLQIGPHELRHRPDGGVVLLHERPQEFPHRLVRSGEVDVAAPDPAGALRILREVAERDRLRVMREHDVGVRKLGRVLTRDVEEELLLRIGKIELHSLQRVMDLLGDVVEGGRCVEHRPVRIDADIAQEGHEVLQNLGDAAAIRGRVDVQHGPALRRLREGAQLLVSLVADDLCVVREPLRRGDRNCVHYLIEPASRPCTK
ncbi:MAG: hypothetical protein E6I49_03880 [Chloroflexi bacterium]|nr:MAG: hypothetical protein E6I49_03880 [Chloroflexota bacterium]